MARRLQADILLVRVADVFLPTGLGGQPSQAVRLRQSEQKELKAYLASLEERFEGLKAVSRVYAGKPRDVLIQVAVEEKCELIVMASHGRSGVSRWLLGSVAESVLRTAPCPILLVRPSTTGANFRNILVPVDGSPQSLAVLDRVPAFMGLHAQVTLVQATELTSHDASTVFSAKAHHDYLFSLKNELKSLKVGKAQVEPRVVEGAAAESILSQAADLKCDLIAMSTHGRSGLQRMMVGSVTERVARHAPCPVLVFPAPNST